MLCDRYNTTEEKFEVADGLPHEESHWGWLLESCSLLPNLYLPHLGPGQASQQVGTYSVDPTTLVGSSRVALSSVALCCILYILLTPQ